MVKAKKGQIVVIENSMTDTDRVYYTVAMATKVGRDGFVIEYTRPDQNYPNTVDWAKQRVAVIGDAKKQLAARRLYAAMQDAWFNNPLMGSVFKDLEEVRLAIVSEGA